MTNANTPQTRLTDDEIEKLSGRELDEAVCIADGWHEAINGLWQKGLSFSSGGISTNLEAAMSLLLNDPSFWVDIMISNEPPWIEIEDKWTGNVLACGDKENAALHLCRAFLKLKNRS